MLNKKITIGLFIAFMAVFLILSNYKYTRTFEEAMNNKNILYNKILHTIDTEKGKVVFYEYLDLLHVGLIEKTFTGYNWVFGTGGESFSSNNDIESAYSNIGKSSEKGSKQAFPLVCGTLMNDEIKEIELILRNEEAKEATIVYTDLGVFWYVFLDKQISYSPKVIGMANDNKIIYER